MIFPEKMDRVRPLCVRPRRGRRRPDTVAGAGVLVHGDVAFQTGDLEVRLASGDVVDLGVIA